MTIVGLQSSLLVGALLLLWRIVRSYVTRSPLDNIPGPPSPSLWTGNIPQILDRENAWNFHKEISDRYGSVVRITEMFGKRALFVYDPKALHSIVVKDQYVYERSSSQVHFGRLVIGPGILSTMGNQHRMHRKSLAPVFSVTHMRYMTPVFYEVMHKMRKAVYSEINGTSGEVDILGWMGRGALELIGQGGLGYSFDPLVSEMKDSYGHALKTITLSVSGLWLWVMLSPLHVWLGPAWFRRFLLNLVPDPNLQHLKNVADIMDSRSRGIYRGKKEALLGGDEELKRQIGQGKDIMSVLLRMNLEAPESERLSEDEVVAQMSTLVIAATDTTSNALARALQLLAEHPEIQEKLRREVVDARNGQDIGYDTLVDLPYLDAVCRETLRVYPPVPLVTRETVEDIMLPLSNPIRGQDGKTISEIFVPQGTLIFSANELSNTNKELWGEDGEEWKPDRWLSPLPEALKEAKIPGIYSNLMTFLGGSRACIGFKFSQLEMKIVLSILLESFKFSPSDKPVSWNFSNITFPTSGDDATRPSLPLKVEVLA